MKKFLLSSLITVLLTACGGGDTEIFKRSAVGNPYEVLVVCSPEFWEAPAGRALEAVLDTDIPGLPQSERSFRISRVNELSNMTKPFRNIINVDINNKLYSTTILKYTKDVFAVPQVVLTIQSPSREEFVEYAKAHPELRFLVTRVGCGIAGFRDKDIAPLFADCVELENVFLPEKFWRVFKLSE